MSRSRLVLALVAGLCLSASRGASASETYLVIVAGLGGEETYRERFHEWSMTMRGAAIGRYGVPPENVFYLGEKPELAPDVIRAESRKENAIALFEELSGRVAPGDQLFLLLVGHGSFSGEEGRFNLPGPDLTPADLQAMLLPFGDQQIVFVNVASASGSFLEPLSGANRIVVTSTKTGLERNESLFGGYFVEAYGGDGADTDKNGRVSVLEAFEYARLQVDRHYEDENLLKTEHALLDDDGDGQGVMEPSAAAGTSEGEDGRVAGSVFLLGPAASGVAQEDLASDPELAGLVEEKQELEGRVEALRLQKDSMPEELYVQELESLLLELARVNQRIEERSEP